MDCSKLQELFLEKSFQCFNLDIENKTINLFNREDEKMDTFIFEELQLITSTLMRSDCDFYVCDNGNIVLKNSNS